METRSRRCHDCPATDFKCKSKNKFCLGFVESLQKKSRAELVVLRNQNDAILLHYIGLHREGDWPEHILRAYHQNYLVIGELWRRLKAGS